MDPELILKLPKGVTAATGLFLYLSPNFQKQQ
jgi:hypothetical protein